MDAGGKKGSLALHSHSRHKTNTFSKLKQVGKEVCGRGHRATSELLRDILSGLKLQLFATIIQ
jgi:hypothetical protein